MKIFIPSRRQGKYMAAQEVIEAARVASKIDAPNVAAVLNEFMSGLSPADKKDAIDVEFRVVREVKELANGS